MGNSTRFDLFSTLILDPLFAPNTRPSVWIYVPKFAGTLERSPHWSLATTIRAVLGFLVFVVEHRSPELTSDNTTVSNKIAGQSGFGAIARSRVSDRWLTE